MLPYIGISGPTCTLCQLYIEAFCECTGMEVYTRNNVRRRGSDTPALTSPRYIEPTETQFDTWSTGLQPYDDTSGDNSDVVLLREIAPYGNPAHVSYRNLTFDKQHRRGLVTKT